MNVLIAGENLALNVFKDAEAVLSISARITLLLIVLTEELDAKSARINALAVEKQVIKKILLNAQSAEKSAVKLA